MKILLCLLTLLVLFGFNNTLYSQQAGREYSTIVLDKLPSFPGGDEALFKFLGKEIRYPAEAIKEHITGVVYLSFMVDVNGKIEDIEVLKGIGGGCDEEAMRVVGLMPKWKPAQYQGQSIKTQYTLPIRFNLR